MYFEVEIVILSVSQRAESELLHKFAIKAAARLIIRKRLESIQKRQFLLKLFQIFTILFLLLL